MRLASITLLALLAGAPAFAQTSAPSPASSPAAPPAAPALAQPGTPLTAPAARHQRRRPLTARFEAANTSNDGKLTLDQARAAHMMQVANHFDAIDTQRRGYVTIDDIRAYRHTQRMARRSQQPAK